LLPKTPKPHKNHFEINISKNSSESIFELPINRDHFILTINSGLLD